MDWEKIKIIGQYLEHGTRILTKYDDEVKQKCIEGLREEISEAVKELGIDAVEWLYECLKNIKLEFTSLINDYAKLGIELKKEVVMINGEEKEVFTNTVSEENKTLKQKLACSIIISEKSRLVSDVMLFHSAVEVIGIGMEEVKKYLLSNTGVGEREKKLALEDSNN